MATSSIKHHFKIEGKENVERFIAAVEKSESLKSNDLGHDEKVKVINLETDEEIQAFIDEWKKVSE